MAEKLTYDYVKNYINSFNYELLSDVYVNAHTKLKVKCDKGHIIDTYWFNFKKGNRCQKCSVINNSEKLKLTYSYVKEYIKKENYRLLSKEYINNSTKLKVKCDKGHEYDVKFGNFKTGKRCPFCVGNIKLEYEYVKNYIKNHGYRLISTEYINNYSFLNIECNKGHVYKVRWNNFKKGHRCPICDRLKTSSKGEKEVLNYIQNIYSGEIIENDRKTILNPSTKNFLELDIFLPEIKLAIEYNGDYWHSLMPVIKNDQIKLKECKRLNIDLYIIDDNNWSNNNKEIRKTIRDLIGIKD